MHSTIWCAMHHFSRVQSPLFFWVAVVFTKEAVSSHLPTSVHLHSCNYLKAFEYGAQNGGFRVSKWAGLLLEDCCWCVRVCLSENEMRVCWYAFTLDIWHIRLFKYIWVTSIAYILPPQIFPYICLKLLLNNCIFGRTNIQYLLCYSWFILLKVNCLNL